MRVSRQDRAGRLSKAKRINGRVIVPASLTRTGVFSYLNPDGTARREYRPPDEVFREDSLASISGAPVTYLHPHTGKATREDIYGAALPARKSADGKHVEGELALTDGTDLSAEVDAGRLSDVSMGYDCRIDATPGVTPEGEAYDVVQRDIVYNHVAIVPIGRAGSATLRLDSAGNQITEPQGEPDMKTERIDGVDYEVGTPAHQEAVCRRDAAETERQKRADALQAERDAAVAKADEAVKRADALEKSIPELVGARVALVQLAKDHGVETKADASDDDIRKAILVKVAPGLSLEGKSPEYIRAALDFAASDDLASAARVRQDAAESRETHVDGVDEDPPDVIARRKAYSHKAGGKD